MPRPDVSKERKEQILDAAAIVFSQQGFANARMDDIVEHSGLSKGALYWYFKSKEDIILALMHRFFTQDVENLNQLIDTSLSARDALLQYARLFGEQTVQMESLTPLVYDYYASAMRDPEKQKFFQNYFHQYRQMITDIVQGGIDTGEFKSIDVNTFAVTLIATIEGLMLMNTIDNTVDLQQQIVKSITLLVDSIQAI